MAAMNQIIDRLWLGNIKAASDVKALKARVSITAFSYLIGYNACSLSRCRCLTFLSWRLAIQSCQRLRQLKLIFASTLSSCHSIHQRWNEQRSSFGSLLRRSVKVCNLCNSLPHVRKKHGV